MTTNTADREAFKEWYNGLNSKPMEFENGLYHIKYCPEKDMEEAWQAAIAYKESLDGWRPIEEAPINGKVYLGIIKAREVYGEPFIAYYDEDEGHCCKYQTEPSLHRPTHFRPLPQPPKENV